MAEQTMRYNDSELQIIKGIFAENDNLLKAIRKVMLQIELDAVELATLTEFRKANSFAVIKKALLPEIVGDEPFSQMIDLFMTIKVVDKHPEEAFYHIKARDNLIKYIRQQLEVLKGENENPEIKFSSLTEIEGKRDGEIFVNLITRNTLIEHTEMQLQILKLLAGKKEETIEQTKERLSKNSSK